MKRLFAETLGSVPVESAMLLGVALAGLAGVSALGEGMGRGIAGGAKAAAAPTMVVSRQAGLEEAGRFAEEVAKGVRDLGHARAAELRNLGRAVWQAEQGRAPTTSLQDFVRALGGDHLRSVTKDMGDRLSDYMTRLSRNDRLPVEDVWDEFSASTAVGATTEIFLGRVASLATYRKDAPWLRLDLGSMAPGATKEVESLRRAVAVDPAMEELIEESGLVVGFADFEKLLPSIAHQRFATQGHTLLINVGHPTPFHLGTAMKAMDDFGVELVASSVVPWQKAGVVEEVGERAYGVLEAHLPADGEQAMRAWDLRSPKLGDKPEFRSLSRRQMAMLAFYDGRYGALAAGRVFMNLGARASSWPGAIADFVRRSLDREA